MNKKVSPIKKALNSDLALKIIAVFFAIILWSYVIASNGSTKLDKTVKAVPIVTIGEDSLEKYNLVVKNNVDQQIETANVRLQSSFNNYSSITKDSVSVNVDYSNLRKRGKHKLQVRATSSLGNVISVSPSTIDVEIDYLAKVTVPVSVVFVGELSDGYYKSAPRVSSQTIDLRGPKSEMERVSKAVCNINIGDIQKSINQKVELVLVDEGGQAIDQINIDNSGDIPSVIVEVDVFPKKTVEIDTESAIKNIDKIPSGYEIISVTTNPKVIDIAGKIEDIARVSKLQIDSISVQNAKESIITTKAIILPEDEIIIIGNAQSVEVFIEIAEKKTTEVFENLPIKVENLPKNTAATLNLTSANVEVTGKLSEMKLITKETIELYVEAKGLLAGDLADLPVKVRTPKNTQNVQTTLSPDVVRVAIKKTK